jgi:hypothetical protein
MSRALPTLPNLIILSEGTSVESITLARTYSVHEMSHHQISIFLNFEKKISLEILYPEGRRKVTKANKKLQNPTHLFRFSRTLFLRVGIKCTKKQKRHKH